MSGASVTSTKHETQAEEMALEVDAIRAMNRSLNACLHLLRTYKESIIEMNNNLKNLGEVHSQWLETLNSFK